MRGWQWTRGNYHGLPCWRCLGVGRKYHKDEGCRGPESDKEPGFHMSLQRLPSYRGFGPMRWVRTGLRPRAYRCLSLPFEPMRWARTVLAAAAGGRAGPNRHLWNPEPRLPVAPALVADRGMEGVGGEISGCRRHGRPGVLRRGRSRRRDRAGSIDPSSGAGKERKVGRSKGLSMMRFSPSHTRGDTGWC